MNSIMAARSNQNMKKIVSISQKRQITIPQKFFQLLGFETEAECVVRDNELIIRPVKQEQTGEFAEQILADLIAEGVEREQLLAEFRKRQGMVRPAVERMLIEAEQAAEGAGAYASFDEIFGQKEETT